MPNLQAHLIEFREHLEAFYDALRLAPPYNTIEKALTAFASEFQSKTQQEQEKIHLDESLKQRLYYDAFVVSGLYK